MRKIISLLLLVGFISTNVASVGAISLRSRLYTEATTIVAPIVYPEGEDFVRLKSLIENTFSPKQANQYNCISNNTLCPNYKYTSIIEKTIKLIVLKTYSGNEAFYSGLFQHSYDHITYNTEPTSSDKNTIKQKNLSDVILSVPEGSSISDWKSTVFGSSFGGRLMYASFGVNFAENANSSTMLGFIETTINGMKINKCQKENRIIDDCYFVDRSNIYLPTEDELYNETIYLNGRSVKISSLKDEIEYRVNETIEYQNITNNSGNIISQNIPVIFGYTLRYKKDVYTLEEAKRELEKNNTPTDEFLVTSNDSRIGDIPCTKYTAYLVRSQCTAALAGLKEVQTALAAYSIDTSTLPEKLDQLKIYIPKFPQAFTDNFAYKATTNTQGQSDYEIRYIGHIGENITASGNTTKKKDYIAMMSGAVVPDIPQIFAHVPSDSMVLYVRNPANLLDILNQKSSTTHRFSNMDGSESIKNLIKFFFELDNFQNIETYLKHEVAIVVNNLDATAPDIVVILSESDREAISKTAKKRVVGTKDGYLYIANSKESLELVMNVSPDKSLKNAPDFQYVWWKKSTIVKDALLFVGDAFFDKMLTLETYLTHYRKYRDYARLGALQELVWAYGDAFGTLPTAFSTLSTLGISTLTGEVLNEYNIVDGLVTHKNIGTLKSLKTLPETRYDLSRISRGEIEDYKYSVLQYRDIWRTSLDPMGIVLNRFGDGMEIDFFMTPIPTSGDGILTKLQKLFEGTTKDSLSFITNPGIRMGLVSLIGGFDVKKLNEKLKISQDIAPLIQEFNRKIMNGKDILDYLGGEFAWSMGSLDPDILDSWNMEKLDAYISVQMATEAKGKELIEILKKNSLVEASRGGGDTESSIFSILTKPLIEDYQGKKIYYVEAMPFPWVGKIGIAYTFVDDFFIIGLNRSTIKHVIDTAKSGDKRKKSMITTDSFEKGTFFATLFDGKNTSQELIGLYKKNQDAIPKILNSLRLIERTLPVLASTYYATEERNNRLGMKSVSLNYTLGSLTISGMASTLSINIDEKKLINLSGSTLEMWQSIKKNPTFPSAILTSQGIPLDVFLSLKNVGDIISLNTILQFSTALIGSESLLRNVTFGLNMGNNEIGFRLRIFREPDTQKGGAVFPEISSNVWIIGGLILVLILLGGVACFVIYKRRRSSLILSPIMTTTLVSTDSPVAVDVMILPTAISIADNGDSIIPLLTSQVLPVDTPMQTIDTTVSTESAPVNLVSVFPENNSTGVQLDGPNSPEETLSETK